MLIMYIMSKKVKKQAKPKIMSKKIEVINEQKTTYFNI